MAVLDVGESWSSRSSIRERSLAAMGWGHSICAYAALLFGGTRFSSTDRHAEFCKAQ